MLLCQIRGSYCDFCESSISRSEEAAQRPALTYTDVHLVLLVGVHFGGGCDLLRCGMRMARVGGVAARGDAWGALWLECRATSLFS